MSIYYDRQGNLLKDTLEWGKLFQDKKYQRVDHTKLWFGLVRVSTVWLGIDHNFMADGPPIIFETMVFVKGLSDRDTERYCTEEQAVAGHKAMVKKWRNPIYVVRRLVK